MRYNLRSMTDFRGQTAARVHGVSPHADEHGNYPGAEVSVYASREVPNFQSGWGGHGYDTSDDFYHISGDDSDEPDEMLTHVPPQIAGAYADRAMRHAVPTMIGLAMHHLGSQDDVPMADRTLTPYSSALSKNAVDRGLAVPHYENPEMRSGAARWDDDQEEYVDPAPDFSDMPRKTFNAPMLSERVYGPQASSQQVSDARNWVKSRLRPTKASRGESQFADIPSESHQDWANSAIRPGTGQGQLF